MHDSGPGKGRSHGGLPPHLPGGWGVQKIQCLLLRCAKSTLMPDCTCGNSLPTELRLRLVLKLRDPVPAAKRMLSNPVRENSWPPSLLRRRVACALLDSRALAAIFSVEEGKELDLTPLLDVKNRSSQENNNLSVSAARNILGLFSFWLIEQ